MSIHVAAATGYAQGARAYASGRPDYPEAVGWWLRSVVGLREGRTAVDLGAGTGRFLPLLDETGARIIAVEPVPAMLARLRVDHPATEAVAATATEMPFADGTIDAVLCAQSFHWFASAAALDEIVRVLKPNGILGLVWNARDESVGWVAELGRIADPHAGDAPRYQSGRWRDAFPHHALIEIDHRQFRHDHVGTPEAVIVDRILSVSFIAALPQDERDAVVAKIGSLIANTPALDGEREVTLPYLTDVFAFRKVVA